MERSEENYVNLNYLLIDIRNDNIRSTKFIIDKINKIDINSLKNDINSLKMLMNDIKVLTHDIKVFKRYFFVNFGIFIFLTICTLVYNVPIYNVPT